MSPSPPLLIAPLGWVGQPRRHVQFRALESFLAFIEGGWSATACRELYLKREEGKERLVGGKGKASPHPPNLENSFY